MQVLRRHKTIALISIVIAVILVVSVLVVTQNFPKPPAAPVSSSSPLPSFSPTPSPTVSPTPLTITPTPPTSAPKSTPTATTSSTPEPTLTPYLFPGEVTQYQGQYLTPIADYIYYITTHPDVAIAGTQTINKATYQLAITGLVSNPKNYTYDQVVNNFNSTLQVATLPCVEGWSVTMLWQGVPIKDLLAQAGVGSNATTLIFLASDGYSTSLPLSYVIKNNIMIAYKMNNVTLTAQTGWPFFLVANNQYGYKWIEWLTEINVSNDSSYLGYWESRGLPNNATVLDPNTTQTQIGVPVNLSVALISTTFIAVVAVVFVFRFRVNKKAEINRRSVNKVISKFWQSTQINILARELLPRQYIVFCSSFG